jgi:Flp pilus assembly pilin Flp
MTCALDEGQVRILSKIYMYAGSLLFRLQADGGQTMAEYVMLITGIVIIVIIGGEKLGTAVSSLFTNAAHKV